MHPVAESGDSTHCAEALALIDTIPDPCSVSFGRPTGLVGMGIIDRLDLGPTGELDIWIMPTIPGCLFLGVIEERIEAVLGALSWCSSIRCHHADGLWEPSRMRPLAAG
jgi:metal-sulfur cluster biosynthetic enzyme